MPTLTIKHYKNAKQPYVAELVRKADGSDVEMVFLTKIPARLSADRSYGDYQVTVSQPGFYRIGNAQEDENGFRLFFSRNGENKFPFVLGDLIDAIKADIVAGNSIDSIALKYFP